jgi:DedD protein
MAFFKFRKDGAEPSAPPPAAESLEAMRKRARHRLIGAAALVLIGVLGFPLLFDSQPRPIDVDIAINIPDKNKVAPLAATPKEVAASTAEAPLPKAEPAEKESLVYPAPAEKAVPPAATAIPEKVQPAKASAQTPALADTKPDTLATGKADTKTEAKAVPKSDTKVLESKAPAEGAKAQTLLDGKEPASAAAAQGARYVVQVGAFAEAQKAREARQTLEKAGFKTYTQIITNTEGKRTRVRVGPIANKAEADKAAEKIKSLGLAAAVLTL